MDPKITDIPVHYTSTNFQVITIDSFRVIDGQKKETHCQPLDPK